jgi:hypothetical protein
MLFLGVPAVMNNKSSHFALQIYKIKSIKKYYFLEDLARIDTKDAISFFK